MRKLLIALAAVASTAALPASAAAAGPPEIPENSCAVIRNTICHLLPPKSADDVCAIIDATTNLSCTQSRAAGSPDLPGLPKSLSSCDIQEWLGIVNVRACEDPYDS